MADKEFLSWIYDRMIYKHGENKNVDYMLKFRSIIDSMQEECNIAGIGSKHATGKLKEVIDNVTKDSLAKARKQLEELTKECMYSKDNYTDEDRKVLCDGCKEECKYASNIPPVFDEGYWERLGEKPVSSIWHESSEIPSKYSRIAAIRSFNSKQITQSSDIITIEINKNYNSCEWAQLTRGTIHNIIKWAYIDELLKL